MSNPLWLLFGTLISFDCLFILVRASFIHIRVPHLVDLRDQDHTGVEYTLKLLERPHLPATLRVGVVLSHLFLGMVIWLIMVQQLGMAVNAGIALAVLIVAGIFLLMLEFALEGLVLRNPEKWALRLRKLTWMIDIIFWPLTYLLMKLLGPSDRLQRALGSMTEDELRSWVEEGQREGSLEQDERKMIYSIFHFSDTLCREIMIPRIDVFALDVNTSPEDATDALLKSGHSRVPVYDETVDNVIGVLYAKDLLKLHTKEETGVPSLRTLLRPVYYVPEAKKVDELLSEMQQRGVHMVVVVDEYGGTAGLVTLEDIVEEIVGEIRDEYDQSEELLYQLISPDEYVLLGRIDLDDLNELLNTHLTKEIADTLGGYIYSEIGRIPVGGEILNVEGWELTVEQVIGRRIRRVRARHLPEELPVESEGNGNER